MSWVKMNSACLVALCPVVHAGQHHLCGVGHKIGVSQGPLGLDPML